MVAGRGRSGPAASPATRRDLLRAGGGLAAAAILAPRSGAAQTFTADSISQAAQNARRDVGRLSQRADDLLRHVVADGLDNEARAVRRFRTEQGPLARDLAAIFNGRVSEDDWLLVVPVRQLDFVLAMRPLVIRIAPTPAEVEAALKLPLAQVEPLAGDTADDVLLALVLQILGLARRVGLFEELRNNPALAAALKDAAAAVKAKRYGLAALELERVMRAMVQPSAITAIGDDLGKDAQRTLYKVMIVRFVPFLGWTYFIALLLATIYFNRETVAVLR